jgi:hypothetical protein
MRKFILTIAFALIAGVVDINAQSETSLGVQYVRLNPSIHQPHFRFDRNTDSVGVVASITDYQTKNIGFTAEGSANFNGSRQSNQLYTAMGGLTLKSRSSASFQPYISGLAGLSVLHVSDNVFGPGQTNAGVAFKAAVGFDVGKGKVKYRPIEAGYLQTHLFNQRQDNLVLSTRIVF